jgi:hypothetical protein
MTFRRSRRAGRAGRFRPRQRRAPKDRTASGVPRHQAMGPGTELPRAGSGDSLQLQAEFGRSRVGVSRGRGQRSAQTLPSTCVLFGGQLTQLLQCVPLRQRRDIYEVAGGWTVEQRQGLVGGHLLGMEHAATTAARFADACA